jgi:hypothetical protein
MSERSASFSFSQAALNSSAKRFVRDAAAAGISLDSLEEVVIDIEKAIVDELNFIASMRKDADEKRPAVGGNASGQFGIAI